MAGEQFEKQEDKPLKLKSRHVAAILVFVFGAWLLTPIILLLLAGKSLTDSGQFGDLFGSINALFSGLAFAGVIIALFYQRQELELQRQELRATRAELAGSREQMQLQNATLTKQNFESTFFNMLNLHHNIIETVVYGQETGRKALSLHYNHYATDRRKQNMEVAKNADELGSFFSGYYHSREGSIGYYLRNLFQIIRYIDESKNNDDEKRFYLLLLTAQLSRDELLLIFYHGLSILNSRERGLLERYSFFQNLNKKALVNEQDAIFYAESAFRAEI